MSEFYAVGEPAAPMATVSTSPVVSPGFVYVDLHDERVQDVLGRIRRAIQEKYPSAGFSSYIGTQPLGVYLEVYTDGDEFRNVLRILDDSFGDLCTAAGVAVCVLPRQRAQAQAA